LHENKSKQSRGRSSGLEILTHEKKRGRSGAYLLLDAEVSGKKRGAAIGPGREQERGRGEEEERGRRRGRSGVRPVIVGEEEGQRLRGEEEGWRLSSLSGKKRGGGAVVVVGFI
jgi:hypothetical protein